VVVEAKCWGVEHLSLPERVRKALDADVDQFGGESCPEVIVDLVQAGLIAEERLHRSIRRLLRDKFRLGLFDDPYVDPDAAERIAGNAQFRAAGDLAQRKSIVLLKNEARAGRAILPLQGRPRIYVENLAPETAQAYGEVVAAVEDADVAVLRLNAPYEPREGFLESRFHSGDLAFHADEIRRVLSIAVRKPTILAIYLDRPAVMPEIAAGCAALLADFGASDAAVLDVLFGHHCPSAKLPIEIPASMDAVRRQKEDVPYDSGDPLFAFGHGLTYPEQSATIRPS
jgi:beta-glucosidase